MSHPDAAHGSSQPRKHTHCILHINKSSAIRLNKITMPYCATAASLIHPCRAPNCKPLGEQPRTGKFRIPDWSRSQYCGVNVPVSYMGLMSGLQVGSHKLKGTITWARHESRFIVRGKLTSILTVLRASREVDCSSLEPLSALEFRLAVHSLQVS